MEESIYRMSLTESLLVLIVIILWLLAVINLARKLERICNPPSIQLSYSSRIKLDSNPSSRPEHSSVQSTLPLAPSTSNLVRATSEPAIDPSPRPVILLRSPSETCLSARSSISQPTILLHPSHPNEFRVRMEVTSPNRPDAPQAFLYPKRLPSIVRRSLLDLHRRALYSHHLAHRSFPRPGERVFNEHRSGMTSKKISLVKKRYERANAIDDEDWHRGLSIFSLSKKKRFFHSLQILNRTIDGRSSTLDTSCFPVIALSCLAKRNQRRGMGNSACISIFISTRQSLLEKEATGGNLFVLSEFFTK